MADTRHPLDVASATEPADGRRRSSRTSGPAMVEPALQDKVVAQIGDLDLAYCFQCGVCSGSCPTMGRMEYGPRRIMHMVRLGLVDQALQSKDIWMCVSCFSCTARCPQGIQIADLMSVLRNMALAKGVAKDQEATFSQTFVDVLQRHGRMYEAEVMLRYYLGKQGLPGVAGLLKQAGLAMNMLRKRKLSLRPERIEQPDELRKIVASCDRTDRRSASPGHKTSGGFKTSVDGGKER
jgi:heterodisulfide reductase subunit C